VGGKGLRTRGAVGVGWNWAISDATAPPPWVGFVGGVKGWRRGQKSHYPRIIYPKPRSSQADRKSLRPASAASHSPPHLRGYPGLSPPWLTAFSRDRMVCVLYKYPVLLVGLPRCQHASSLYIGTAGQLSFPAFRLPRPVSCGRV